MAEPIVAIASRQLALVGVHPSAQLSACENFFQKNTTSEKRLIFNTSRLIYISKSPSISPIFGTKQLLCRRFLQHYYRDTFIESHRKPTDLLW